MGTFGGALEARQIDASDGKLTAEVTGEVEGEGGVLVIRRIHVSMRLVAPEDTREKGGTRARRLSHELPFVPDLAQRDPTHVFIRFGGVVKLNRLSQVKAPRRAPNSKHCP